jgi:archaellum component FlaC
MDSFNQTNPVHNYNELIANINDTIEAWNKLKGVFREKLPILIENFKIRSLLITNMSLLYDLLRLKMDIGNIFSKYIIKLPVIGMIVPQIEHIDNYLLTQLSNGKKFLEENNTEKILEMIDTINPFSIAVLGAFLSDLPNKINSFNTMLINKEKLLTSNLESMSSQLRSQIDTAKQSIKDTTNKVQSAQQSIKNKVKDTQNAVNEVKESIKNTVDEAHETVNEIKQSINDTMDETKDAIKSVKENIKDTVDETKDAIKKTGQNIKDTVDVTRKAANEIKQHVKDAVDETKKTAKDVKNSLKGKSSKKHHRGGQSKNRSKNRSKSYRKNTKYTTSPYSKIYDPLNNRYVNIKSKQGRIILNHYLNRVE